MEKFDSNYDYYEIVFDDGFTVSKVVPRSWYYNYGSALPYILSDIYDLQLVSHVNYISPVDGSRKLIAKY